MKPGWFGRVLLALALAVPATAAQAAKPAGSETGWGWLERMLQAAHTLRYEGTFVYQHGQELETLRVVRSHGPNGDWQRLTSLSGPPREILVAGDHTYWLTPNHQVAFTEDYPRPFPLPAHLSRQRGQLERYYELQLLDEERVAGRQTRVVAIKPRDAWRFGYRLWLEPQTGMALRAALVDETGQTLEQMIFTEFQLKPADDLSPPPIPDAGEFALLNAPVAVSKAAQGLKAPPLPAHDDQASLADAAWRIEPIPAGFAPVSQRHFTAPSGRLAEHRVFSDGLATISVFLEQLEAEPPLLRGASRWGSMNAYGVVIAGYQALVVGEAPAATVREIASAIQRLPAANPP